MFSHIVTCWEETNMAVASIMMACKIGLIWRHMKTLYTSKLLPMPGKKFTWAVLKLWDLCFYICVYITESTGATCAQMMLLHARTFKIDTTIWPGSKIHLLNMLKYFETSLISLFLSISTSIFKIFWQVNLPLKGYCTSRTSPLQTFQKTKTNKQNKQTNKQTKTFLYP